MNGKIAPAFKSRLIQACYDYCVDMSYAPMVGVVDGGSSRFPSGFASEGFISFDLSDAAVRSLEFSDETITFDARFNGVPTHVVLYVDEIAWAGSPTGDCILGFTPSLIDDDQEEGIDSSNDDDSEAAAKAARANLKLL